MSDATLNELRQRLTRVESRLCRVADHLGANVGDPRKELVVNHETEDNIAVSTPAMDVTLSEIANYLRSIGKEDKVAFIYFKDRLICRFSRA